MRDTGTTDGRADAAGGTGVAALQLLSEAWVPGHEHRSPARPQGRTGAACSVSIGHSDPRAPNSGSSQDPDNSVLIVTISI